MILVSLFKTVYRAVTHGPVIYFHVVDGKYMITHGFTKKTQRTPRLQIEHAEKIRKEYFRQSDKGE
ncbi:type II toxin-antitoxin system RelE/ParE family toxin [Lacticaseibacillus chiayiensis]|uniref:type II toxin-antitoxin system RelE/ParE family toxin n=1 Tax=Lacticaseibacillus chiayiensis TaxID=2100821 RepID=UPI003C789F3C